MTMLTQGCQLFALMPSKTNPAEKEVLHVTCVTSFSPGGNPADQIEVTDIESDVKRFVKGLRTPAQATIGINVSPEEPSHIRLHEQSEADGDTNTKWALGFADGKGIKPTLNATKDDWELPTTRSWFVFDGYVADFPLNTEPNSIVKSEVPIQRSGGSQWIKKA